MDVKVLFYLKKINEVREEFGINPDDILELTKLSLQEGHSDLRELCKEFVKDSLNTINGYSIDYTCNRTRYHTNVIKTDKNFLFATHEQASSTIAMAILSQIIANDKRFGGPISNSEWDDGSIKYRIIRLNNDIYSDETDSVYTFLAFHTKEQRDLFLKENIKLIRQYYML